MKVGEKMVEIKWKPVLIGLVIAIILGLLLGILASWGDILGYLIATIYVGYSVDGNYMNGVMVCSFVWLQQLLSL